MNKILINISLLIYLSGCTGLSNYAKNIVSDTRNEKLIYKTDEDYSSGQIELVIPPNLTQPDTKDSLTLPEVVEGDSEKLFTVDTKLKNIQIFKQGKDMFLTIKTDDKINLWNKLKAFWLQEGFQMLSADLTISSMRTNYLENLSEVQLGTIQRLVGRYVPLLVSPETRDSYTTRIIKKDNGYDVIVTHYGKEFMSDGDSDFRWQNRARDAEFENEMISRMYIFLGGNEAREAGYVVSKTTGTRNSASIFTDDQGLQTLFVPDIYERVYPSVVSSLEILGIRIINQDQSEGTIKINLEDKTVSNQGFLSNLFSNNSSEEMNIKINIGGENRDATLITIENDSFTHIQTSVSEEVLRGLYVNLR